MYLRPPMLAICVLELVSVAAARACRTPKSVSGKMQSGKAAYFITNDQANAIVALPIGPDGHLSEGTITSTGGSGMSSINGMTNQPAAPDGLVSQSAVALAGNYLFTINAGSNTVVMFKIDSASPTKLTMVGQPAIVPGEFPNTVTASETNRLVCVGTTGSKAGVSCTSFSDSGMGAMDSLRAIALNQTTPPVGPTNTVSQVFFSDDQKTLYATVKGDPVRNNTGFFASYQVGQASGHAAVAQQPQRSSPAGTAVLFGSFNIPESNNIFATDASFGAAVLSVDQSSKIATVKAKGVIDGQKATCWSTFSKASNSAFVTDVGLNRVVEMSLTDASVKNIIDLSSNGDQGLIDLKAAGNFVYALAQGNGTTSAAVTVLDAVQKKQVQHLQLQNMGVGKNA
ncbi:3-carboxymuconate cyclase [Colletotrichum camelliae]|nr:3-carboxymuconate cyclase [Colletotrichum camelliae]